MGQTKKKPPEGGIFLGDSQVRFNLSQIREFVFEVPGSVCSLLSFFWYEDFVDRKFYVFNILIPMPIVTKFSSMLGHRAAITPDDFGTFVNTFIDSRLKLIFRVGWVLSQRPSSQNQNGHSNRSFESGFSALKHRVDQKIYGHSNLSAFSLQDYFFRGIGTLALFCGSTRRNKILLRLSQLVRHSSTAIEQFVIAELKLFVGHVLTVRIGLQFNFLKNATDVVPPLRFVTQLQNLGLKSLNLVFWNVDLFSAPTSVAMKHEQDYSGSVSVLKAGDEMLEFRWLAEHERHEQKREQQTNEKDNRGHFAAVATESLGVESVDGLKGLLCSQACCVGVERSSGIGRQFVSVKRQFAFDSFEAVLDSPSLLKSYIERGKAVEKRISKPIVSVRVAGNDPFAGGGSKIGVCRRDGLSYGHLKH